MHPFAEHLDLTVAPAVGRRLQSVRYGTIEGEYSATDIAAGVRHIGGEVELLFEGLDPMYVGWEENAGWQDHFSLAVRMTSTFKPNTLVRIAADTAPEWATCIGERLTAAECRGANETPHVLILRFGAAAIALADGYEGRVVDGDDVIVLPRADVDLSLVPQFVWRAAPAV